MHGPAVKLEKDNASEQKSKLGVKLFIVYLVVYGGFVAINTIAPKLMASEIFLGLNLAVVYGFGLIILAIVMGTVYNHYCTMLEERLNKPKGGKK